MTVISDLKLKISNLGILINCVEAYPATSSISYNNSVKAVLGFLQEEMGQLSGDLILELAKDDEADAGLRWNSKCIGDDRNTISLLKAKKDNLNVFLSLEDIDLLITLIEDECGGYSGKVIYDKLLALQEVINKVKGLK